MCKCCVSAEPSKRRVQGDDLRLFFFETCLMGCRSQGEVRERGFCEVGVLAGHGPGESFIYCFFSSDSTL